MKIGTHIGVGRHGSNGGLKDEIRNKTKFLGRHVKKTATAVRILRVLSVSLSN